MSGAPPQSQQPRGAYASYDRGASRSSRRQCAHKPGDTPAAPGSHTPKPAAKHAFTNCDDTVSNGKVLSTSSATFDECATKCAASSSCESFTHDSGGRGTVCCKGEVAGTRSSSKQAAPQYKRVPRDQCKTVPGHRGEVVSDHLCGGDGQCVLLGSSPLETSKGNTLYVKGQSSCKDTKNMYIKHAGYLLGESVGEVHTKDAKKCMDMCELDARNCGGFVLDQQNGMCVLRKSQKSYYAEASKNDVSYVNQNSQVHMITPACYNQCDEHKDDRSFNDCVKRCKPEPAGGAGCPVQGYAEYENTMLEDVKDSGYLNDVTPSLCGKACNTTQSCDAFEVSKCVYPTRCAKEDPSCDSRKLCTCTLLSHGGIEYTASEKKGVDSYIPSSASLHMQETPSIHTPVPHHDDPGADCAVLGQVPQR